MDLPDKLQLIVDANTDLLKTKLLEADVLTKASADAMSGNLKGLASTFTSLAEKNPGLLMAGGFVAAGAAVFEIGKKLVDLGEEWQKVTFQMERATGAQGAALESLMTSVKQVYSVVPESSAAVGSALADLYRRTGETGTQLENLTRVEVELARVTGGDLTEQTKATSQAFAAWKITTQGQQGALDLFFKASQASGIGVNQLASEVTAFSPKLQGMGFSLEQSVALLAEMDKNGVVVSRTMMGLGMAMRKWSEEGKQPQEELAKFFQSIKDAPSDMQATAIAASVMGARAVDMGVLIRSGRMDIQAMMDALAASGNTINETAEKTETMGEKWTVVWHGMLKDVVPVASAVLSVLETMTKIATDPATAKLGRNQFGDSASYLLADRQRGSGPTAESAAMAAFTAGEREYAATIQEGAAATAAATGYADAYAKAQDIAAGSTEVLSAAEKAQVDAVNALQAVYNSMVDPVTAYKDALTAAQAQADASAAAQNKAAQEAAKAAQNSAKAQIASIDAVTKAREAALAAQESEAQKKLSGAQRWGYTSYEDELQRNIDALKKQQTAVQDNATAEKQIIQDKASAQAAATVTAAKITSVSSEQVQAQLSKDLAAQQAFANDMTAVYALYGKAVGDYIEGIAAKDAKAGQVMAKEAVDRPAQFKSLADQILAIQKASNTDITASQMDTYHAMAQIAATGGAGVAAALAKGIASKSADVLAVINSYSAALAAGLNPVLKSVGGQLITFTGDNLQSAYMQSIGHWAEGGMSLPQQATIQSAVGPRGLVQWAEPETKGEAFIPLAPEKRARSLDIWAQTGRLLGAYANGGILTAAEIAAVSKAAGFSGQDLIMAIAIAEAESGGNPLATNHNKGGSTDYGLFEINDLYNKDALAMGNWRDPWANARMAMHAFQGRSQWDHGVGGGWRDWSSYLNGSYRQYMSEASAAAGGPFGFPVGAAPGATGMIPGGLPTPPSTPWAGIGGSADAAMAYTYQVAQGFLAGGAGALGSLNAGVDPTILGSVGGSIRSAIVKEAAKFLGVPYVWGGEGPAGFDCSGLVQYVFGQLGIQLPRVSQDQQRVGTTVSEANAQPGDLVFFGNPAHHVTIYAGNGRDIEAPHTGANVEWGNAFRGETNIKNVLGSRMAEGGFNGVRSYDQGGLLQPGLTLAYNGTGRPEAITSYASGGISAAEVLVNTADLGSVRASMYAAQLSALQAAGAAAALQAAAMTNQITALLKVETALRAMRTDMLNSGASEADLDKNRTQILSLDAQMATLKKTAADLKLKDAFDAAAEATKRWANALSQTQQLMSMLGDASDAYAQKLVLFPTLMAQLGGSYQTAMDQMNSATTPDAIRAGGSAALSAVNSMYTAAKDQLAQTLADTTKQIDASQTEWTTAWTARGVTLTAALAQQTTAINDHYAAMNTAEQKRLDSLATAQKTELDQVTKGYDDQLAALQAQNQAITREQQRNTATKTMGGTADQLRILQGQGYYTAADVQTMASLKSQLQQQQDAITQQDAQWARDDTIAKVQQEKTTALAALTQQQQSETIALQDQVKAAQASLVAQQAADVAALAARQTAYQAEKAAADAQFQAEKDRAQKAYQDALDAQIAHYQDMAKTVIDQENKLLGESAGYFNAGYTLGQQLAAGVTASLPLIEAAGMAAATVLENYLKLHSPAKQGPLSNLDTWFSAFMPTILKPFKGGDVVGHTLGALGSITTTAKTVNEEHIYLHDQAGNDLRTITAIADAVSDRLKRKVQVLTGNWG